MDSQINKTFDLCYYKSFYMLLANSKVVNNKFTKHFYEPLILSISQNN